MNDLTKALQIALKAHDSQVDLQNKPYILHVLRVMLRMNTVEDMVVAALHDVVEDSGENIEDFSADILEAVHALTKLPGENYENYIARVKENPTAVRVKLADLADNTDETRGEISKERKATYLKAIQTLTVA